MIPRKELKNILKGRIYRDHLKVAQTLRKRGDFFFPFEEGGLKAVRIESKAREWFKTYAVNKFYKVGNIPVALGLAETLNKHPILHQEMNIMLDSGACMKVMDTKSGTLAAVCLNCVYQTDPGYDAFPTHGVDWLNVAAEIANESTDSKLEATVIWRDLHYQWLYHKFQEAAQKKGRDFIFYFAIQYTEKAFRNGSLARNMINFYMDETLKRNGYFGIMGTFSKYQKFMMEPLKDKLGQLEYVPYSELKFQLKEGDQIFANLAKTDGDGMRVTGSIS